MSAMRFRYRRGLTGHGGYRGKERLHRDRSRASRCQARQLIEDYLETEDEAPCRVRIGHRNEFIPSLAESDVEVEAREEQLSLPLGRNQDAGSVHPSEEEPVLRLHTPEPAAAMENGIEGAEDSAAPAPHERAVEDAAVAVEKPKRPAYDWFADRRPVRPKAFQRGHFLYGCALGTAAAAAILAMLRVAFM